MAQSSEKRSVLDDYLGQRDLGEQVRQCDKHGQYTSHGKRYGKIEVWSPCPTCTAEAERLAQQEQARRTQRQLEESLHFACVPRRFVGKTFDTFDAPTPAMQQAADVLRNYAADFERHFQAGTGLILMGTPGTGKSHLAVAVLQSIMPKYVGMYATCADVIREVRSTWGGKSDRSERDVMQMFAQLPLLVLDEVGVQNGTDNEQHIIFGVLDARYRDLMPTIILTNQTAAGLKNYLGERSYDRLRETAKAVQFKWDSYRKGVAK